MAGSYYFSAYNGSSEVKTSTKYTRGCRPASSQSHSHSQNNQFNYHYGLMTPSDSSSPYSLMHNYAQYNMRMQHGLYTPNYYGQIQSNYYSNYGRMPLECHPGVLPYSSDNYRSTSLTSSSKSSSSVDSVNSLSSMDQESLKDSNQRFEDNMNKFPFGKKPQDRLNWIREKFPKDAPITTPQCLKENPASWKLLASPVKPLRRPMKSTIFS